MILMVQLEKWFRWVSWNFLNIKNWTLSLNFLIIIFWTENAGNLNAFIGSAVKKLNLELKFSSFIFWIKIPGNLNDFNGSPGRILIIFLIFSFLRKNFWFKKFFLYKKFPHRVLTVSIHTIFFFFFFHSSNFIFRSIMRISCLENFLSSLFLFLVAMTAANSSRSERKSDGEKIWMV